MTKLLPCPFCGAAAEEQTHRVWRVHCQTCSAQTLGVDAWNRRAPDPGTAALKAHMAELRRALSEQMAWVQCWIRDAECDLVPTMNSLQRAEREIAAALAKGGQADA